jgi:hypothetical protein
MELLRPDFFRRRRDFFLDRRLAMGIKMIFGKIIGRLEPIRPNFPLCDIL